MGSTLLFPQWPLRRWKREKQRLLLRQRLTLTSCMPTMECSPTTTTPMCTTPWPLSIGLRRLRPRVLRLSLSCHLPTPTRTPTTLVSTLDTWSAPSSTPWFPLWPQKMKRRERRTLLLRLRLTPGSTTATQDMQGMHPTTALLPDTSHIHMDTTPMLIDTSDMESKQRQPTDLESRINFCQTKTSQIILQC